MPTRLRRAIEVHALLTQVRTGRYRALARSVAAWACLVAGGIAGGGAALAQEVVRSAASFDRAALADPSRLQEVRASGSLGGGPAKWGLTGAFDYDFTVERGGWYELLVDGTGSEVSFLLDPAGDTASAVLESVTRQPGRPAKAGNLYLAAGPHTLRLERWFWTGFPQLLGFRLRPSDGTVATSMRAWIRGPRTLFRIGECTDAAVEAGGNAKPLALRARTSGDGGRVVAEREVRIAAAPAPQVVAVPLPCAEPGRFRVAFSDSAMPAGAMPAATLDYEVIDTRPHAAAAGEVQRTLVAEIDLAATPPDFFSGGATRITQSAAGRYRETDPTGFTNYQRATAEARAKAPAPGWFAYRLPGATPGAAHVLEVDYPDDAVRTMAIVIRERAAGLADVAGGVDTGGEFTTSGRMLTHAMLFWPKEAEPRVTILSAHDGQRAAAARIRLYRIEGPLPPLRASGRPARRVVNWYEEGNSMMGLYGAAAATSGDFDQAVARWAPAARHAGYNVLSPAVLVYSFALYPSRYHRFFSKPGNDTLLRMVLHAERAGVSVLPELHPRADELDLPFADVPDPKPHLLVSKDGRTSYFQGDGRTRNHPPHYNPLHPANQAWYLGMIGELAERYRDSPALAGVSLRLLPLTNATLNNFHSLDWGYDDFTVGLFERETGTELPVPKTSTAATLAANAKARHAWLMANARESWIRWRCEKIAALYTAIRDRVRAARPDLVVQSLVFEWERGGGREALRSAGIDPALLGRIEGVQLVNALPRYGRREPGVLANQRMRDNLLDPERLATAQPQDAPGAFLSSSYYVEGTGTVTPPAALGFPEGTKPKWFSAAVEPAGRHVLERYAVQLAETDAQAIGDGGNGYSLGQPLTREWLREYLALPPEPFEPRADARDPVAVWSRSRADGLYFYAVNRERVAMRVAIALEGARAVNRLAGGGAMPLSGGQVRLELAPYELVTLKADSGATIRNVTVEPPAAARAEVQALVNGVRDLATSAAGDRAAADVLSEAARLANADLERGHLWRARTRLEHHRLVAIYERLGRYPAGLRDKGAGGR